MDIQYIAGFGPIGPDAAQTFRFWSQDLGIAFDEPTDDDARADGYADLPSFLAELRTHVPDLADDAVLDVVAYRLADPARA